MKNSAKTNILQSISEMIHEDLSCSRKLLALMEQESAATQSRNFDILEKLVNEKNRLLIQIKHNADRRYQLLTTNGKKADEAQWLNFLNGLENAADNHALTDQWKEIQQNIENCQAINNINGKVIQRGIKCHEQLIRLMRGNNPKTGLYNAQGKKQVIASGASFVEA